MLSSLTPFPGLCSCGVSPWLIRTLAVLTKTIRPFRSVIVTGTTFFVFAVAAAVIVVESRL